MKSCPTCNRTFEDTFTFCLVDGAILSAPFDPLATQIIPGARQTEPPPTEVIKLEETRQEIPLTIASPASPLPPQEAKSPTASLVADSPPRRGKFKLTYVAIPTALIACVLILIYLLRSSSQCPSITVRCYPFYSHTTCEVSVQETQSISAHTLDFRPSARQAQRLTGSIALLQPPPLPKAVTDVRWTTSAGRIDQQGQSYARIETMGMSGQKITVTASVSGYGAACTASDSFVVPSDVPTPPEH